jgi:hypothetical protein
MVYYINIIFLLTNLYFTGYLSAERLMALTSDSKEPLRLIEIENILTNHKENAVSRISNPSGGQIYLFKTQNG